MVLEMCNDTFLVTKEDEEVIGYIIGYLRDNDEGHIMSVAIDPDYRGKGIGTKLIREDMERLKEKGADRIGLEVRVSNNKAIKLYEGMNFHKTKRVKDYYQNGEDAWYMIYDDLWLGVSMITFEFSGKNFYSKEKEAFDLHSKSKFGVEEENKIVLSFPEALYLLKKEKIKVTQNSKVLKFEEILKIGEDIEDTLMERYLVYKDLRERGYIVKSGMKYGSHFRAYRGNMEEHAPYIIRVIPHSKNISPIEITGDVRVAGSVRKKLIYAFVDEDNSVVYYGISWEKL